MKAKTYLTQIKKLDCMIENKRAERDRWLSIAYSTTAGATFDSDVRPQPTGNNQRMANAIVNSVDIGAQLEQSIQQLFEVRQQIVGIIEQLAATEYDLLHKIYVGTSSVDMKTGQKSFSYMTLQEVAAAAERSYSWAANVHRLALHHVQSIIDAHRLEPLMILKTDGNDDSS